MNMIIRILSPDGDGYLVRDDDGVIVSGHPSFEDALAEWKLLEGCSMYETPTEEHATQVDYRRWVEVLVDSPDRITELMDRYPLEDAILEV
jgi:hypothetical protein